MERKDWLYIGLNLVIIIMLTVVFCNQIAIEKELDAKIQQVEDRVNFTGCVLEYDMDKDSEIYLPVISGLVSDDDVEYICELVRGVKPKYDTWGVRDCDRWT